jgi:hypothetical protein
MYPRIDLCDGTEPTISELLKDPYVIYDTSGYGNDHTIINTGTNPYYNPFTLNPKKFTFNDTQSIQRIGALNGVTNACTVVMFYSTTDTTELWCMGSSNASWYLGASSGNSYYHSNCGNPTYWVDLKSTINPWSEGYRNGNFHMWEAKNVDFSAWTAFDWFGYPGVWRLTGNVAAILVYNRALTAAESAYNYTALRAKYGI